MSMMPKILTRELAYNNPLCFRLDEFVEVRNFLADSVHQTIGVGEAGERREVRCLAAFAEVDEGENFVIESLCDEGVVLGHGIERVAAIEVLNRRNGGMDFLHGHTEDSALPRLTSQCLKVVEVVDGCGGDDVERLVSGRPVIVGREFQCARCLLVL